MSTLFLELNRGKQIKYSGIFFKKNVRCICTALSSILEVAVEKKTSVSGKISFAMFFALIVPQKFLTMFIIGILKLYKASTYLTVGP